MSYTEQETAPQRWTNFHFFKQHTIALPYTGDTDGVIFSVPWQLGEVRVHWSTAFASGEAMKVFISSVKGSYFNTLIFSTDMSAIQDYRVTFSDMYFFSDDHLVVYFSNVSHVNVAGIEFIGWSVRG